MGCWFSCSFYERGFRPWKKIVRETEDPRHRCVLCTSPKWTSTSVFWGSSGSTNCNPKRALWDDTAPANMTGSVKRAWHERFSFRAGHSCGCMRFEEIVPPWVVPDRFPNTGIQWAPNKTSDMPFNKQTKNVTIAQFLIFTSMHTQMGTSTYASCQAINTARKCNQNHIYMEMVHENDTCILKQFCCLYHFLLIGFTSICWHWRWHSKFLSTISTGFLTSLKDSRGPCPVRIGSFWCVHCGHSWQKVQIALMVKWQVNCLVGRI